jgi:hypothetical protein
MSRDDRGTSSRQHLRATAGSIAEHAERVAALEEEKERLPAGDPRVLQHSREVDALIDRMAHESEAELELARRANDDLEPRRPIN